ncbi:PIN domain-containing protein [uncultured Methanospirillum sp.]|uniref:PIN domain-containing protein n=1 Tax=uncultured Methanospirillum sp. TaxID=262503 RepID=UPI0029C95467|nr:PIN domain-containing protein [uncultured Methanospirillum sp.]
MSILDRCRSSELTLLGSVAIDEEISYIVDYEKKVKALRAVSIIHEYLPITSDVLNLTKSYESYGLHLFDALHCACATVGNSIFLTTDDQIISAIRKNPTFGLIAHNPASWLMRVKYEDNQ